MTSDSLMAVEDQDADAQVARQFGTTVASIYALCERSYLRVLDWSHEPPSPFGRSRGMSLCQRGGFR